MQVNAAAVDCEFTAADMFRAPRHHRRHKAVRRDGCVAVKFSTIAADAADAAVEAFSREKDVTKQTNAASTAGLTEFGEIATE
ncbi:hypothetical protein F2P81_011253 [Scophthalmus maximus]|uniref:Uncharacterized protein n=1 Tax=Scophthalmus maximus TaxID=52904 RepID=A0A6A4SY29_SCOMX|nr:hypothetical protein F2P81_011253 [Scophthalmus maximus]